MNTFKINNETIKAGLIVNITLAAIWLLLFINLFFEIPYFGIFFLITIIAIIIFHNIEKNTFTQEFNNFHFDFKLRQYSQNSKFKEAFTNILFIAVYTLPFIIKIWYKERELLTIDYLYVFIFLILIFYTNSLHKLYKYYYLNNDFIKKPGRNFEKILWTDINKVEENEAEEIFVIHLKNGQSIKFGVEIYYTFGKNKDEIIKYIRQRIKNAAQQAVTFTGADDADTKKYY